MYPDFKELLSALNEHHVKYIAVGAYAVSIHAQPRATKDMDIPMKPDATNGLKSAFISRDDLIAAKLASGRSQDLAGVSAIQKALQSQEPKVSRRKLTELPGLKWDTTKLCKASFAQQYR